MKTINPNTAKKQLVSQHRTMLWETSVGRVSIRKTDGRFIVRLEDYETQHVTVSSFATLPGALVCAENLVSYYL